MKRHVRFFPAAAFMFLGLGSLLAAEDAQDEAVKQERMKYFGEWQVASLEIDGNQLNEEDVKKYKVVNGADGTWNIAVEDRIEVQGTSRIDPTKAPKTVELTVTEGASQGETILGIYELGEDTRKVCFARQGDERPSEFAAPAGSGRFLALLKRIKK